MPYMTNIELFDEYTARILAELYESFPRKKFVDGCLICGHTDESDLGIVLDPQGRESRHFEIAMATLEWLIEAGYVRAKRITAKGAEDAVLTAQALLVLKSSPKSLQPSEAIGEKIARFVRTGSIDMAKQAVHAAISAGIGTVIK